MRFVKVTQCNNNNVCWWLSYWGNLKRRRTELFHLPNNTRVCVLIIDINILDTELESLSFVLCTLLMRGHLWQIQVSVIPHLPSQAERVCSVLQVLHTVTLDPWGGHVSLLGGRYTPFFPSTPSITPSFSLDPLLPYLYITAGGYLHKLLQMW